MATLGQVIEMATATAISGSDPDSNVIQKLRMEAEPLVEQALHALSSEIALNGYLRARMMKQFTSNAVGLGIFDVPATVMVEFLREGQIYDTSTAGVNSPVGDLLRRVENLSDLFGYLIPVYGYYCVVGSSNSGAAQIYTKQIGTGSTSPFGAGPLLIHAAYTPTKADLNAAVVDEILDELVVKIALRLRGTIAVMEVAAA